MNELQKIAIDRCSEDSLHDSLRNMYQQVVQKVMMSAYLPGHDGCHDIGHPWEVYEQGGRHLSFNWGEIGIFNDIFEVRVVSDYVGR